MKSTGTAIAFFVLILANNALAVTQSAPVKTSGIMIISVLFGLMAMVLVLFYFMKARKFVSGRLEKSINYFIVFGFLQSIFWIMHLAYLLGTLRTAFLEHFFALSSYIALFLAVRFLDTHGGILKKVIKFD
ncbi:MAG: hypothetical protein ACE5DI_02770 [Candidatus Micrarchaeia archaeon]